MSDIQDYIDGGEPDQFDPEVVASEEAQKAEEANRDLHTEEARVAALKESYVRLFEGNHIGDDIQNVMLDLMGFCRAHTSTFDENDRLHARFEGRREVYQRIMDFTRLDRDTLFLLYMQSR